MTAVDDPHDAAYLDQKAVRDELTRAFDLCHGCRQCVGLCGAFPTLFDLLDGGTTPDDAGSLTPAEQDSVVDQCHQCKLCAVGCPYGPGRHEAGLDLPRLLLRAEAMRRAAGLVSLRRRRTTAVLGRTDAVGRLATSTAPIANRVVSARAGSVVRRAVAAITGVSAVRLLPPYAKQRFSTWFRDRTPAVAQPRRASVTLYPTCTIEYQAAAVGHDLVRVYERNGIGCSISEAGCCGAPWLHAGDLDRFHRVARANVRRLARELADGGDLVVAQPTCSFVLRHDYVGAMADPDDRRAAEVVAGRTCDAMEYLRRQHDDRPLDTDFGGDVPASVVHHLACHQRAQHVDQAGVDLMRLTGTEVHTIAQCSGIDGLWGLRAENEQTSIRIAERLGAAVESAIERADEGTGQPAVDGGVVTGDCHLANTAIAERTGRTPSHPVQVLARAYGLSAVD